ncbi:translation elongation factor Ts [Spirulina subsalsa FACHB-351]|uniref:Elongation factor Ts n=1 Tax=Spirulina subsalsa FACHB-351 TaxID=234711 RepID=A0ABT3L3J2_9CYAN|nr:translation elongation factor Ts [Spirulina subsalsa]MCW6035560.1 translation elongation factor Ts [Spirulina subsalsa FACHB-351]
MAKKDKKTKGKEKAAKAPAPAPEETKVEAPAAAPEAAPAPAPEAAPAAKKPAGGISAALVKELREQTGAGMMDCKKALTENDGDMEKAVEWLRKKGIASADKKAGRVAAEGLVDSYIHTGGRVGVLVEVNCETDFVARGDKFKALVRDIAMQIAACPNVVYVKSEDVDPEFVAKEKAIEMGREDLASKPENIREKIVQGRIDKQLKEMSLMDQPYIKDQTITVQELVKRTIADLGENIQVRRFSRFVLGEGIEKEETNFAEEVAAQAGQK